MSSHHSPLFHKTGKPHLLTAQQTVGAGQCLSWDSQHRLPVASYTVCLPALAGRASAVRWSLKGFYPLIYLSEAPGNRLIRMYPSLQGWKEAESEEDAANSRLERHMWTVLIATFICKVTRFPWYSLCHHCSEFRSALRAHRYLVFLSRKTFFSSSSWCQVFIFFYLFAEDRFELGYHPNSI